MDTIGIFFVAIAVGYWVLTMADKEGNRHAQTGKILGWGIIAASLAIILVRVVFAGFHFGSSGERHSMFGHHGYGQEQGHWRQGQGQDGNQGQ